MNSDDAEMSEIFTLKQGKARQGKARQGKALNYISFIWWNE